MRLEIGNWTLEKASNAKETDKTIPIRMVANKLQLDKEGQQILPQAFNKATVDRFLSDGYIDWHHVSVTGKTPEERANAIIGKPYDFQWENNVPVVYGNLTKAHPIVKNSIMPHLDADQKVFGASVGGNVEKARNVIDSDLNSPKEQILAINWEHIAIAASSHVISSGSEVSLVKAKNSDSKEPCIKFADISAFEDDHDLCMRGDEIRKALEVGAGTDSATLTGMDALRQQSKQKKGYDFTQLLKTVAAGIRDDTIGGTEKGLKVFLKSEGLSNDDINDFVAQFRKTVGLLEKAFYSKV